MATCPTCSTWYSEGTSFCAKDGSVLVPERSAPGSSQPSASGEAPLDPGTMVGEYRVEGVLGEGGFGTVFRAMHPMIGKNAAIKVLKREFSAKADMVSRFLAEARSVNQIRHRNIIDIFSFGVLPDGRHYYVMELLEGTTFDRHVAARGGRLPVDEALAILRPLARALGAAHAQGIAHRDLKPENVFLTVDEEGRAMPKLLDFGIAKLGGDLGAQHKTQSGIPVGTPSYMSPEQVHGRSVDHRTDIYAFGVLVFEILTGELPFTGESMIAVMVKHAGADAPRMSERAPDLSPELDAPVLAMMAKDPANRPQSVLAAVDQLTEAAGRAGFTEALKLVPLTSASGPGAFTPAVLPTPSKLDFGAENTILASEAAKTFEGTESIQPGAKPTKRGSGPIVAVAVLAAVGLGVGGYFAMRPGAAPAKDPPSTAATQTATTDSSAAGPAPTQTVVVSVAPAASAPPTSVTLVLKCVPPDVDVFRGEEKLGPATAPIKLPFGKDPIKLTVKRAGYLPTEITVTPDRELADAIVLKPVPRSKKDYEF